MPLPKLCSTCSWVCAQVLVTKRVAAMIARTALNPMESVLPCMSSPLSGQNFREHGCTESLGDLHCVPVELWRSNRGRKVPRQVGISRDVAELYSILAILTDTGPHCYHEPEMAVGDGGHRPWV